MPAESIHNTSRAALRNLPIRQVDGGLLDSGAVARFWAKVARRAAGGCWLWTASCFQGGYGQFHACGVERRQVTLGAHRVSWALSHGSIPDGFSVLHRCDAHRRAQARLGGTLVVPPHTRED